MSGRTRAVWWAVAVAAVLANALVQSLTAVTTGTPGWGASFSLLLLASIVSVTAALAFVSDAVSSLRDGRPWRAPRAVTWFAALTCVVLVFLVATTFPPALPVVVVLACIVLPAVAAGQSPLHAFQVFRRTPGRAATAVVLTLIASGLLWLGALLLGFFVAGAASAFLTWALFGFGAVGFFRLWPRAVHDSGVGSDARPL